MKTIKTFGLIALTAALALPLAAFAADQKKPDGKKSDVRPYKLDTCVVTGEKLGGEMGKPVVYEYKGQEVKFCCKSCRKDFDKDPAKYLKKMAENEKKAEADKKPKTGK